jgi:iron complex transport system substrate-binding protein
MRVQSKILWCCATGLCLLVFSAGCSYKGNDSRSAQAPSPSSIGTASNQGNPPSSSVQLRYAKGFTLEQRDGYRLLRVLNPWRDAHTTFAYALVPRGTRPAQIAPGATIVETPVRRIAIASTTFVYYFAMLGLEDTIAGMSGTQKVNTPSIAARIQNGSIQNIGDATMDGRFNMERLINIRPELLMVYGTGDPQYDQQDKLLEAGFRVAVHAGYMETTPLGRTEWIKVIAAFFNKDAEADRLFTDIAARYENLAAKTRATTSRPTVFCNANFRGSWHIPGGNSYAARFFSDAGAHYLWSDDSSNGGIPMNIESVLGRAKDADFWLNPGSHRSMDELLGEDERYSIFRAFRTNHVYNNNAIMDAGGGNDIWETGVANPDRVLADLISIFHPEILPGHQRTWYWQLPKKTIGRK